MMTFIKKKLKPILKPFYIIRLPERKSYVLISSNDYMLKFCMEKYLYDIQRFLKYSTFSKAPTEFENLRSRITAHYHVLEKGLSFPETRLGYGKEILETLLELIELYQERGYCVQDSQFVSALKVLNSYCEFHEERNYDVSKIRKTLAPFEQYYLSSHEVVGGVVSLRREEIQVSARGRFEKLALSRYSIREFSKEKVDISLIVKAVEIARKTPSVCNRQSARVYLLHSEVVKQKALSCQNGNRGFGHLADKVLIITSSIRDFYNIEERNQSFIDGGMFGMSIIYALHSLGIGTCTLNWSATNEADQKIRQLLPVKEEENIVFMIALGMLPEIINVPASQRKPLEEILTVLE